ncbi:MAG: terminase family protein, partial [Spirochaetales bacterium]|nr:terminase family protein [Spirochaetales bacterium]MBR4426842.1 terminase family protein [Spirochaetales bacterium]
MENEIKSILLPYQQKWVADKSQVKIAEKSRRIGLTWSEAVDDVLLAASRAGMDVYYISYNFEFTKEFIQTCKTWAKLLNEAASEIQEEIVKDEDEEFTCSKIVFPSGFKIMGLPARATTIRGRQGKIVIDEAAFCENLDELLKAAMAMLMWGGAVSIISTHNGEDNLFNETIKDARSGKNPYSLHKITITDALHDGLYKRICERKREEWTKDKEDKWLDDLENFYGEDAAEELFCIPRKGGSRYFSSALVESCQGDGIPVLKYEQSDAFTFFPKEERDKQTDAWFTDNLLPWILIANANDCGTYIGQDFARSGDLTVIVIAQKDTELTRKTVCNIEIRNVPFDQQHRILQKIFDTTDHIWGASLDARGNGQMLAELLQQEYGSET